MNAARIRSVLWSAVLVLAPSLAITSVGLVAGFGRPVFLAGFAGAVLVSGAAVFLLRRHPELIAASLLIWLSIQRFVVAALAPALSPDQLTLLLAFKELFFPILGIVLLPQLVVRLRETRGALLAVDLLAISFGILVLLALVLSPAPIEDRILYARRLAVLPLVYVVARLLPWRRPAVQTAIRMVVVTGLALSLFGLAERFLIERTLWRDIVPAAYYYHLSALGGLTTPGTDFPVDGLPRVFYDFTAGAPERRLVSTFIEATTLAAFLAIATLLAFSADRLSPLTLIVGGTIAATTVLTLSKAGMVMLAVGGAYLVGARLFRRFRDPAWMLSMAAGLAGALLLIALALQLSGATTGALAHFRGLREGVESVVQAPLGRGLGVGGGFADDLTGGESTFGVLLVQLGLLGLLIWAAWIVGLAFVCARHQGSAPRGTWAPLAIGVGLIAFFGTASLTESAGGLLGNWIYAFLGGALVTGQASKADA